MVLIQCGKGKMKISSRVFEIESKLWISTSTKVNGRQNTNADPNKKTVSNFDNFVNFCSHVFCALLGWWTFDFAVGSTTFGLCHSFGPAVLTWWPFWAIFPVFHPISVSPFFGTSGPWNLFLGFSDLTDAHQRLLNTKNYLYGKFGVCQRHL